MKPYAKRLLGDTDSSDSSWNQLSSESSSQSSLDWTSLSLMIVSHTEVTSPHTEVTSLHVRN